MSRRPQVTIHDNFQLGIRLLEQDSYEKVDTLEQLQKQLEDTRSINLRLFEEIREKNEKEKMRIKKLEESHNVSCFTRVYCLYGLPYRCPQSVISL